MITFKSLSKNPGAIQGLDIQLADKAVEAGIHDVLDLLSMGRLKVFASCTAWFEEFRLYRRDEQGRIVKQHDHLMDCTRYLVRGRQRMITKPRLKERPRPTYVVPDTSGLGWMGRWHGWII